MCNIILFSFIFYFYFSKRTSFSTVYKKLYTIKSYTVLENTVRKTKYEESLSILRI